MPQAGAEYIVLGRQLVPDASARLRRAHRRSNEVSFHIAEILNGSQRMSATRERNRQPPCCIQRCGAGSDPDAIIRGGRRLDHAEGNIEAHCGRLPSRKPRGAKGSAATDRLDQQEAAARFIAATEAREDA